MCHVGVRSILFDFDIWNIITGAACGTENAYPFGAADFTSGFTEVHVVSCNLFFLTSRVCLVFWIL